MPNISLRGIDDPTLGRIRASAKRRKISVNRLIVDTLRAQFGEAGKGFDDLDDLAGKWTDAQAREFDAAVAPFGEIEPGMWAAESRALYKANEVGKALKTARGKRR